MRWIPTIHPRRFTHRYSIRAMQFILGSRRFDTGQLLTSFPEYLESDMDIELVNRQNVLSSSYETEKTYFVKVVSNRHLKAHRFMTWWRNRIFQISRVGTPFASFDTPLDMVKYEYEAAQAAHNKQTAVIPVYDYASVDDKTAALLYEYVPNTGKVEGDKTSLRAFEHVVKTVRSLHDEGFVHTSLPYHVIETHPEGEPYVVDPVGRVKNTEQAQLLGIGFDLATLISRYSANVGTLPVINVVQDYYSDVELIAAYKAAVPVQATSPSTRPWIVSHIRSTINEVAEPDAVDRYAAIMGEQYDPNHSLHEYHDEDLSDRFTKSKMLQSLISQPVSKFKSTKTITAGQTDSINSPKPHVDPDVPDDQIRIGDYDVSETLQTPEPQPVVSSHHEQQNSNDHSEQESLKSYNDEENVGLISRLSETLKSEK